MRIYLAAPIGMYQPKHTMAARGGASVVHRVLLSFLPQFKTVDPLLCALERSSEPVDYCVDSGAHVWLNDFFKKQLLPPVNDVEAFIRRFVASVTKLPRAPTYVVELDLQRLYGGPAVERWRREIWMPFEKETGIRVCYVWHPSDGLDKWKEMLDDTNMTYLAMASNKLITEEQRVFQVFSAFQAGKPVHGFAAVDVRWIKTSPFYSVDSTSWAVSGQAFGNAAVFDPHTGKLKRYRVGNKQMRDNSAIAQLGLLRTGIHASDVIDLGRDKNQKLYSRYYTQSALPYRQLEEWHTARWRNKGVDWEAQLARSGYTVPNFLGGHRAVGQESAEEAQD